METEDQAEMKVLAETFRTSIQDWMLQNLFAAFVTNTDLRLTNFTRVDDGKPEAVLRIAGIPNPLRVEVVAEWVLPEAADAAATGAYEQFLQEAVDSAHEMALQSAQERGYNDVRYADMVLRERLEAYALALETYLDFIGKEGKGDNGRKQP